MIRGLLRQDVRVGNELYLRGEEVELTDEYCEYFCLPPKPDIEITTETPTKKPKAKRKAGKK